MLLSGKVALLAGAHGETEEATALALAEEGAHIVLLGSDTPLMRKVRSVVEARGGSVETAECDLSDAEQTTAVVDSLLGRHGHIDILVNTASAPREGRFLELPLASFDAQLDEDFRTPLLLMRTVLPTMLEHGQGAVVNLIPAGGTRGAPGSSAQAAANAALINLTRSVGEEVKSSGVRVNCVCPGPTETRQFRASANRDYELSRGGDVTKPTTVANTILYLASDMSRDVNCQVITVRGANRW